MSREHREGQTKRAECIPESLPRADEYAVGFDIETTGIGPSDLVTVACVWSPQRQEHCFYGQDPAAVMEVLDAATYIYTFNGVEFDLPRFAKHCGCSMDRWILKTVDPLFAMKQALGFGACVKLNDLLHENGFSPKSGSGLQAIEFWNDGKHEALMAYCMDDARLTYELCASKAGIKWAKRWVLKLRNAQMIEFQPVVKCTSNATDASASAPRAPPPARSESGATEPPAT
jgi:hypothetical protein